MTDSIGERVAAEKAIDLGAARARRRTKQRRRNHQWRK